MLIVTRAIVEDKQEVCCSVCHQVVGLFSPQEMGELSVHLDAIYCFDCDSVQADTVHPSLYVEDERYFLWFDGTCRSINLSKEVRVKQQIINIKNQTIEDLYDHLREIFGGKKREKTS